MGIQIKGVKKAFGVPPTVVLNGITLGIEHGEFVAVTGKSGSGKSTLLYIISTLDQATSGSVVIDDFNVNDLSERDIHLFRNQKMGFVFQFHHLLPELKALENILMPAMKSKRVEERRPYAMSLLKGFGLENKADRFPSQLSGGEQQRVAIARALVMEPKYLFADEPTGNLDSTNARAVMDLFRKINKEKKMTVVYVTHDPDFAAMANRQIQLIDGQLSKS